MRAGREWPANENLSAARPGNDGRSRFPQCYIYHHKPMLFIPNGVRHVEKSMAYQHILVIRTAQKQMCAAVTKRASGASNTRWQLAQATWALAPAGLRQPTGWMAPPSRFTGDRTDRRHHPDTNTGGGGYGRGRFGNGGGGGGRGGGQGGRGYAGAGGGMRCHGCGQNTYTKERGCPSCGRRSHAAAQASYGGGGGRVGGGRGGGGGRTRPYQFAPRGQDHWG